MSNSKDANFFEKVYEVVRLIPKGRVSTYGEIAKAIGSPQAARMVGWAMNNSHNITPFVPAHRVVNRNGMLTGKHHFAGQNLMQNLLNAEGIRIIDDKILKFSEVFWSPLKELDIET